MDAAEDDQDVLLQRTSPELLADLQKSIEPFLWKSTKSGRKQIRRRVRVRETDRLVNLLEPFQELPQLLDPHLDKLVPVLADAFLAFLRSPASKQSSPPTQLLTPLSSAICRLLYTFCKIRGEKVIVRFFSTETRHLELLLSAIEEGQAVHEDAEQAKFEWDWEERYITLLWLSQLLLAPFDLSTISSAGTGGDSQPEIPSLVWPENTPGVALRVIPLSIRYLASSGKERDAAKVLLVRISMRRDMQEIGILEALVQWSLSSLNPSTGVQNAAYFYIGVLSYLAGILSSSTSTKDMQSYLPAIFERVQSISSDNPAFQEIHNLAIARKTIIKVLRTISILTLQFSDGDTEIVEGTIASLLESLADAATPVRLAASKALSMITLKLEPDFANEVVEAVLEFLKVNVTWNRAKDGSKKGRDLSRVNSFEWHGLILTLSHLLYRHSPPTSSLPQILAALFLGLSFEQRSTTGASVGTNVRDAACFGIWALARRYKTEELQNLDLSTEGAFEFGPGRPTSVLQRLATLLVVSASLDPAGNIRRGSSAALQELIGRHPDTIDEGIPVVQVVDYHAVALRSRAIQEVAVHSAQLSDHYHFGLMDDLLGWRGVQDSDANVRRNTATAVGVLSWAKRLDYDPLSGRSLLGQTIVRISRQLEGLAVREIEERHGLLLCLAVILEHLRPELSEPKDESHTSIPSHGQEELVQTIIICVTEVLTTLSRTFSQYRHPELIAEATSRLILATYPIIRKDCGTRSRMLPKPDDKEIVLDNNAYAPPPAIGSPEAIQTAICADRLLLNPSLRVGALPFDVKLALRDIDLAYTFPIAPNSKILSIAEELLEKFIPLNDAECVDLVADAAVDLLLLLPQEKRNTLIEFWNTKAGETGRSTSNQGKTYVHILFRLLPLVAYDPRPILSTIKARWATNRVIESSVTILNCLAQSEALFKYKSEFIEIITRGLDDYTTTARGDIGSFVRIEALKVVGRLWFNDVGNKEYDDVLVGRVLRLAGEKLDKVRAVGREALVAREAGGSVGPTFASLSTSSSPEYFTRLLTLATSTSNPTQTPSNLESLLEGYVTSADTGSEDLIRSSRLALYTFCSPAKINSNDGAVADETKNGNSEKVFRALSAIMKAREAEERIVVPAMEVLGFLGEVGCWCGQAGVNEYKLLFLRTQKAHFKTPNIKKLEAAVKIYGCLVQALSTSSKSTSTSTSNITSSKPEEEEEAKKELLKKIKEKLCSMLTHPFPRVRERVAEELWVLFGVGKGVDFGRVKGKDGGDGEGVKGVREAVLGRAGVVVGN